MGSQANQNPAERIYTADELAEVLKLSSATLTRRMRTGEIKAFKVGRGWRITKSVRDAYLASLGFPTSDVPTAATA